MMPSIFLKPEFGRLPYLKVVTSLLLMTLIASCGTPDAQSRISFAPSPDLMSGDGDGAGLFMLERTDNASGRQFKAQLIMQGHEENWIAFHALSNDATQSLGSVIQPYLSEIEMAHGATSHRGSYCR